MKMRKGIAAILAAVFSLGSIPAMAADPVAPEEKEPWERDRFRKLVWQAFEDGNWEEIRDWATMEMDDVLTGTDTVNLEIRESQIKMAHKEMLGVQNDFSDTYELWYDDGKLSESYLAACDRMVEIPTFRLGGTTSNYVNLANNLDLYDKRIGSEIISLPEGGGSDGGGTILEKASGAYRLGLGETLQMIYANNPEASLIPCISILTTSPEDVKKIVHFLQDEADESEWGKMRSEIYGIKEPVEVAYWEMSNEIDQHTEIGREWHAETVRPVMEAILEVDSDAKILVCGPSAPWATGAPGNREPKIDDWVAYITEQCGDLFWGMSWHPYYDGYGTAYMLWMTDDIKSIMDETALKMGFTDKDGNPKDFKIVGTEGARFDDPADRHYPGSANFESALSTAHFLNVMQQRDYYWGNMLHNYYTQVVTMWPYLYVNEQQEFFLSPTVKMYEVYNEAMGDVLLETDWCYIDENGEKGPYFTESCYEDWGFSAAAYASGEDEISVVVLNKDNYREKDVTIDFENDGYVLTGITKLDAPNLFTFTWDRESEDLTTITREEMNEKDRYTFHMDNGSLIVLHYKDPLKRNIAGGGSAAGGAVGEEDLSSIESGFCDIEYSWAKGEISKMQSLGFVSGRTATEFAPRAEATNAEMAAMLTVTLGLDTDFTGSVFYDVPQGAWYEKYANACYAKGILTGTSFNAAGSVTLRELLTAAARVSAIYRGETKPDTQRILKANGLDYLTGSDGELIAGAIHNGYMYRLYETGQIHLDEPVTREEMTSILYRLYNHVQA